MKTGFRKKKYPFFFVYTIIVTMPLIGLVDDKVSFWTNRQLVLMGLIR